VRREKLQEAYDENPVEGTTRQAYVEQGIKEYNTSFRPKLIALVFVVPPIIVAAIVYITNAN
jgi:hypothetical protein